MITDTDKQLLQQEPDVRQLLILKDGQIINQEYLSYIDELSSDEILENYIHQVPKNKFYILGSGDFIKLEVSENLPELTRVFSINGEGYSKLPKLNLIYTRNKNKKRRYPINKKIFFKS